MLGDSGWSHRLTGKLRNDGGKEPCEGAVVGIAQWLRRLREVAAS